MNRNLILFAGPTGVGKTELAKLLATETFNVNLIRLDMSEYQEKVAITKLIGAAPGYIGYKEGGQLTEAVKKNPYSVILFDEIEKAHKDIYDVLLQILDEGRLTDNKGITVDFSNTLIILTTNVGAGSSNKERYKEAIQEVFRPEFLNRLSDISVFNNLNEKHPRSYGISEIAISSVENIKISIEKFV